MNTPKPNLRIGIVFSGGFAKGAYEIGFCKALLEYTELNNIKAVSGASIGALNAYGFINNKLDYLTDIWENLEFKSAKEFFVKSDKRKIIYDYIEEMQKTIEKNNNHCYINYIKIPNISLCYKNINKEEMDIQKNYLKASISVPGLYNPIQIFDDYFIDGAFLDNTPIAPLENENLDLIFVLRFDHAGEQYKNLNTNAAVIEIVFDEKNKISDYFYFNSSLTSKLINSGYKKSKELLDLLFMHGDNLDYIKALAKINNQESCKHFIPKNGEEVVQKINKLRKMFKKEYDVNNISIQFDEGTNDEIYGKYKII